MGVAEPDSFENYASPSSRLLGQAIDGIVAFLPLLAVALLDTGGIGSGSLGMIAVASIFAYYFLADALPGGQSVGKRWLGMRVVDADTGAPCSLWQSFLRNLLLALLGPLDWVFIFGARHQRLGDKAAGTIVIVA